MWPSPITIFSMVFCFLPVVSALSKLANGKYPGRHFSDYLSSEDMEKTGRAGRPQLGSNPFHHCIKLCVTINLNAISFQTFLAKPKWFQVVVKGLGLQHPSLSSVRTLRAQSVLDFSQLQDVFLYSFPYDEVNSITSLSSTPSPLSLSLTLYTSCDSLKQILHSFSYLCALHLDIGSLAIVDDTVLGILCETSCQITALTLNKLQIYPPTKEHNEKLGSCLQRLHGTLEYLRLVSWPLTNVALKSLALCSHLRVISIVQFQDTCHPIQPVHTISEIFQMLAYNSRLEFFEWSEGINIRTEDILCLYRLLMDSLPCLHHWHMKLSYLLLSTTDLQNSEYSVLQSLLMPLLCDKIGDESCTTFRFSASNEVFTSWICSVREDVCFRLFHFS